MAKLITWKIPDNLAAEILQEFNSNSPVRYQWIAKQLNCKNAVSTALCLTCPSTVRFINENINKLVR